MTDTPNLLETVAGAFLHDIGKFLQRAHGSVRNARPAVQARMNDILKTDSGNYTHKHALWTDEFFQWMDDTGLSFPAGLNRARVRDVAVYHHNPLARAAGHICTEADRLASGMDRKPNDENREQGGEEKGWDAFIRTPLISAFSNVDIHQQGAPPKTYSPLAALTPADVRMPRPQIDTASYQQDYRRLAAAFQEEFARLCQLQNAGIFLEALKSLSERYLYAVPSSTVDQPDISLHDHSHAVAAIAAALYRWHETTDTLADSAAVRNRDLPKFRFVAGDLSGIQSSLFLLANQQVRGASKILRARSFLLAATIEAAALLCRKLLGYPAFSILQNAGGRFLLLVANTPDVEGKIASARQEIETWMYRRHLGEVACNIAATEAIPGRAFQREAGDVMARAISRAVDDSKARPFSTQKIGIHQQVAFPADACVTCGRRPAKVNDGDALCEVCAEERRVGGVLPRLTHLSWHDGPADGAAQRISFFGGLTLALHDAQPRRNANALSIQRLWRGTGNDTYPVRWLSNYVPRLAQHEIGARKYRNLSAESGGTRAGDLKTFEHLAWDAAREVDGGLRGQPMLAVLKADVDNLGAIFGFGIPDRTLGRVTALSRMLDFFFTGYLCHFLEQKFPRIYTVYAGGDDLLLVGPWIDVVRLAPALYEQFNLWTGGNPNITLSAGIELMKMNHPIRRTVEAADVCLDAAKNAGKNRACLFGSVVTWPEYRRALDIAEEIGKLLDQGSVSQVFVYRLLEFDQQRRRAEPLEEKSAAHPSPLGRLREEALDIEAASWRARWGYHLKRNVLDRKDLPAESRDHIARLFSGLLGLDRLLAPIKEPEAPVRVAVAIALYNNRSAEGR